MRRTRGGASSSPHESGAHNHTLSSHPAHLGLNHVIPPPAKVAHEVEHIDLVLGLHHLDAGVQGDEGAGPPHPRAAVYHHGAGVAAAGVVGAHTLVEGQDVRGVVGHTMVRPGQEVELLDMTCGVLIPVLHGGGGRGGGERLPLQRYHTPTHLLH